MTTAPAAVIAEPLIRTSVSGAHAVRTAIWSLLAAVVIVVLSLQVFSVRYGVEHRLFDGLPQTPAASNAVDRLVLEQQAGGLTCRAEPALTDTVVFQYGSGESAALLTFDRAVAAQKAGAGSIQRYCF